MWTPALSAICEQVTSRHEGLSNPVLYLMSWTASITSCHLLTGFVYSFYYGKRLDCEHKEQFDCQNADSSSLRVRMWSSLVCICLVVTKTAHSMVMEGHCNDLGPTWDWSSDRLYLLQCDRHRAAVGLGILSVLLSSVWTVVNVFLVTDDNYSIFVVDNLLVAALLLAWIVGATWLLTDRGTWR